MSFNFGAMMQSVDNPTYPLIPTPLRPNSLPVQATNRIRLSERPPLQAASQSYVESMTHKLLSALTITPPDDTLLSLETRLVERMKFAQELKAYTSETTIEACHTIGTAAILSLALLYQDASAETKAFLSPFLFLKISFEHIVEPIINFISLAHTFPPTIDNPLQTTYTKQLWSQIDCAKEISRSKESIDKLLSSPLSSEEERNALTKSQEFYAKMEAFHHEGTAAIFLSLLLYLNIKGIPNTLPFRSPPSKQVSWPKKIEKLFCRYIKQKSQKAKENQQEPCMEKICLGFYNKYLAEDKALKKTSLTQMHAFYRSFQQTNIENKKY